MTSSTSSAPEYIVPRQAYSIYDPRPWLVATLATRDYWLTAPEGDRRRRALAQLDQQILWTTNAAESCPGFPSTLTSSGDCSPNNMCNS